MAKLKTIPGGKLIIFEGSDGTGKSTQLALVRDYLIDAGWQVKASRNLGGTPIGEKLREVMFSSVKRPGLTDLYISLAVHAALVEDLADARQKGLIILLDRSPMSMVAYESHGSGVNKQLAWHYADQSMKQLKPDLIIFYTCPIEIALKRAKQRGIKVDYFGSKPLSFFERTRKGLDEAASRYGAVKVDGSGSIDEVLQLTLKKINKLL